MQLPPKGAGKGTFYEPRSSTTLTIPHLAAKSHQSSRQAWSQQVTRALPFNIQEQIKSSPSAPQSWVPALSESLTFYLSHSTDFTIWLGFIRLQRMQKSTASPVRTFSLSASAESTEDRDSIAARSSQRCGAERARGPHSAPTRSRSRRCRARGAQPAGALMTTPAILTKFPPGRCCAAISERHRRAPSAPRSAREAAGPAQVPVTAGPPRPQQVPSAGRAATPRGRAHGRTCPGMAQRGGR